MTCLFSIDCVMFGGWGEKYGVGGSSFKISDGPYFSAKIWLIDCSPLGLLIGF